ncbi:ABC transporter substrate-binding protein [Roseicella aerolata]|uniref:ABC transporter substrate-binding protein n=1 Tax=Roseicella aerolata TaxID=2883479 RepID=A0A9X1LA14_9PROT|nr:ABC transporter substrate-binding protein [Roseicella aerolata]MCB4821740.1 ABC transporter substrate-binding protein [Roseicella aerolata]
MQHPLTRRGLVAAGAGLAALPAARGRAQASPVIRLGVLSDFSGPYRDWSGPTTLACVQQAVEEMRQSQPGLRVEILQADHQNKTDVGVNTVRQWFDQRDVDAVVDCNNSAVGLAVAGIAREKNKVFLASGASTAALTGAQCTPNTVHWTYDTYMLAKATSQAMVRDGGESWFFITADYAFGHQIEREARQFIEQAGGKVLGAVRYPFPQTTDFGGLLLQAQASGAKVLGLANAGADTVNSVKQAQEFGLGRRGMRIALMLAYLTDIHTMGLQTAQGLRLTESFYWDLNDRTRAFWNRVKGKTGAFCPNQMNAGGYAATLHYLKACADMGAARAKESGRDTVARMKAMPTDDDCFGPGSIRVDGRKLHPAYLFEVKRPQESQAPFDYYRLVATTPPEQAFRPLSEGGCTLG